MADRQPTARELLQQGYKQNLDKQQKEETSQPVIVELTEAEQNLSPTSLMAKWYSQKAKQDKEQGDK